MQKKYIAKTPAKVNLSLVITGKRNNLHELDMIMCPIDIFDEAQFVPSEDTRLTIDAFATFEGFNTKKYLCGIGKQIEKVAKALRIGGKLSIIKNIPLGAGLGGSSASITSSIKAMQAYCMDIGKNSRLDTEFLLALGSDVPYMYHGGVCKVQGVGEIIKPIEYHKPLYFVLAIANGGADSKKAYTLYDNAYEQNRNGKFVDKNFMLPPRDVEEAIAVCKNDLTDAAIELNKNIAIAKAQLEACGVNRVIMSGSGSTVIAICDTFDEAKNIASICKIDGIVKIAQKI